MRVAYLVCFRDAARFSAFCACACLGLKLQLPCPKNGETLDPQSPYDAESTLFTLFNIIGKVDSSHLVQSSSHQKGDQGGLAACCADLE
jgi:hypothetical protein